MGPIWDYIHWKIFDISTLSTGDYISLIGQFHSIEQDNEIDPRLLDRGFTDQQLDALKAQLDMKTRTDSVRTLNVHLKGNLNRFKYDNFSYVINLHSAYERNGTLPYPGSYSEQPAHIVEVFGVLDQLTHEKREVMRKEYQKEAKKNG